MLALPCRGITVGSAQWPSSPEGSFILLSHDSSVLWQLPLFHCVQRMFASQTEGELKVTQILKENFPQATAIKVTDISGKIFLPSYRVW